MLAEDRSYDVNRFLVTSIMSKSAEKRCFYLIKFLR